MSFESFGLLDCSMITSLARVRVEERYGEVRWLNAYSELYRLALGVDGSFLAP